MHPFVSEVPAFITELKVGQTVLVDEPGVYGYAAPSVQVGVIVAIEPSKYHGVYIVCDIESFNLPKRCIPAQIIGHVSTDLVNEETAEVAVTSKPAAA